MDTLDFEQIALRLLGVLPDEFLYRGASASSAVPGVVDVLRQVWNARGAADLEQVDALSWMKGALTAAQGSVESLERAIRSLDR